MPEEKQNITLGSGKLYTDVFTGAIPTNILLEVDANLLGLIEGGAALEYKPKFITVTDDLGLVSKTILTEENATIKSGVMTWNGKTLEKLCNTARVTEVSGKRTVKIGGIGNQDGKKYIIRFVHLDPIDGDVRITIVGSNQAGFKMAFAKDKATIVDAEFKAEPNDNEGTLIILEETIPPFLESLTLISLAGGTIGTTEMTVSPALTVGNSYMSKTAAIVTLPALNDICNVEAGFVVWDGVLDITAVTGEQIEIVEVVSGTFAAVKAAKTTVVSMV